MPDFGGKSNARGAALGLTSMAIYATHDVIIKHLGQTYSPVQIVFFAALLSFPLLSVILLNDKREGSLRPVHPGWVVGRVVTTVVTGLCAFYAFSTLPLAQVYPLLFAMPLLVTVFSIPILGERVGIHRWAAVILGLIGVVIVVRPGQAELAPGHFAAMTAAVTGALASVIVRKIGSEERSVVLLLSPLLGNVIVMAILLPFVWQPLQITDLGLMAVIAMFGLTASFLQILAYRAGEAAIVAPMQYSQILWAVFYGWIIFHESVDIPTLVGAGVVILSGIYIVIRETRVSTNQPVLRTRGRSETATAPRSSLLGRVLGLRAPNSRS
ncbi:MULTISPECIES: DMT family transporter [Thioclava]|uniref:EamA family transporter n=1 Tax=Thioclava nitratireducens TaxID=1915078 RepID=A0ABM6IDF0_9RHOB|nr:MULTISPECIES: DMT family transporter [Thioclava]AQS46683.1 EamA family transporter [Thioclava nitratireducens]OWY02169.1 EamA family transporter [Thioclava sp. IC9]OWY02732.1 EamA family transporter [Thioclava sp. F1Mire-8]OWY07627.1 EamA family transporter [Thioclava sp. F42-5]OWY13189.1 EamA family transporter [Thioclava sp. F34-6]